MCAASFYFSPPFSLRPPMSIIHSDYTPEDSVFVRAPVRTRVNGFNIGGDCFLPLGRGECGGYICECTYTYIADSGQSFFIARASISSSI